MEISLGGTASGLAVDPDSISHKHPPIHVKLVAELRSLPPDFGPREPASLTYMNNVIEETLRLHPVVPEGPPRTCVDTESQGGW